MTITNRKASIVLPTYNRKETLSRAINSSLNQTLDEIEIIVVDDGSSDDTKEVIQSEYSNQIEYIRYGKNSGANFARTVGALASNGRYVSFLDSDDELHPNHVERAISVLEKTSEDYAGAVVSNTVKNGNNEEVRHNQYNDITSEKILDGAILNGYSSLTIQADILQELLPLDTKLPSAQEDDLYIRLANEGYNLKGIKKALVTYHTNKSQISENVERRIIGQERLLEKHSEKLSKRYCTRLYYNLGFLYYKNGDMNECRKALANTVKYDPTMKHWYHYLSSRMGETAFRHSITLKKLLS